MECGHFVRDKKSKKCNLKGIFCFFMADGKSALHAFFMADGKTLYADVPAIGGTVILVR